MNFNMASGTEPTMSYFCKVPPVSLNYFLCIKKLNELTRRPLIEVPHLPGAGLLRKPDKIPQQ